MADDGQVVVLVLVGAREPLRPLHVLHLGHDADLGQFRHDHLAALARVGRRRQRERELQRRGDAGFFQQCLGFFGVVGVDAGGVHVTGGARHVVAADRHAVTTGRAFDHRLAVDGGADGAAHAHVVQRLVAVVDGQHRLGARAGHDDLVTRVVLEARHAAVGDARKRVHVTRQQGCHLGRRVANEAEGGALDPDGAGIAEARPGLERHRRALAPLVELVRPRAHRRGVVAVGALGLDDHRRGLAHVEQEVRVRLLVDDHHRVVVEGAHAFHGGEGALVLVGALLAGGALEAELHRLRVERLAILEGDTLAQVEGDGAQVGRELPALCQQRRHAAIGIDLGERLQDVVLHDLGDGRGGTRRRVQPRRLQRHAQRERGLAGLGMGLHQGQAAQRGGGRQGQGEVAAFHRLGLLTVVDRLIWSAS